MKMTISEQLSFCLVWYTQNNVCAVVYEWDCSMWHANADRLSSSSSSRIILLFCVLPKIACHSTRWWVCLWQCVYISHNLRCLCPLTQLRSIGIFTGISHKKMFLFLCDCKDESTSVAVCNKVANHSY